MADRTVTVKSSGGDYSSLNSAFSTEDDTYADLVTNTMILTFDCYNFEDTTAADTGTAWTTSSSYYLNIVAHDSHGGKVSTNSYRLKLNTTGNILTLTEKFTRVTGLQVIGASGASYNGYGIFCSYSSNEGVIIDKCIIANQATNGYYAVTAGGYPVGFILRNSIIYGWNQGDGFTGGQDLSDYYATIQNCTFIGNKIGVNTSGSYLRVDNCLCSNNTTSDFSGSTWGTSRTNASSDTTAPGTNSRISQTFTFVDATNKDYHLASADAGAIGFGTDLSGTFTTDIDGVTRSGTWDIGADEYVASGTSAVPKIMLLQDHFSGGIH